MAIATKEEVQEALKESREREDATIDLINMIEKYIEIRDRIDSKFDGVSAWELSDSNNDDGDIDFYGDDSITLEWTVQDRCGYHEYHTETFPIEHLWSDEWENEIRAEIKVRKEREARERAERKRKEAERKERNERARLRLLAQRYPDELAKITAAG